VSTREGSNSRERVICPWECSKRSEHERGKQLSLNHFHMSEEVASHQNQNLFMMEHQAEYKDKKREVAARPE